MWLRELGGRERARDNYALGDLLIAGKSMAEAEETVGKAREERCGRNQERLHQASTVAKRIRVVKELLNELWEELENRAECRIQRLASAMEPTPDMDTVVGCCIQETVERQTKLGEDCPAQVLFPNDSFTELEVRRLHAAVAPTDVTPAPPLEPVD